MSGFFDLTFDDARVQRALSQAPSAVFKYLRAAIDQDGEDWEARLRSRMTLRNRTRTLTRGINHTVTGRGADSEMRAFIAGVPYAHAQEFGATIKPTRSKFLTIPIDDNLTGAGVPRFPSARGLPWYAKGDKREPGSGKVRIIRTKSGKLYIVRDAPGNVEFLFMLVRQVTLPGPTSTGTPSRLGFFDSWQDMLPSRQRRHAAAIEQALAEATTGGKG